MRVLGRKAPLTRQDATADCFVVREPAVPGVDLPAHRRDHHQWIAIHSHQTTWRVLSWLTQSPPRGVEVAIQEPLLDRRQQMGE